MSGTPLPPLSRVPCLARCVLLVALAFGAGCKPADDTTDLESTIAALQRAALADDTAWRLLESLTAEAPSRMGGSEGDAKAVTWARRNLEELGFDRVWLEHVSFPLWLRNGESAHIPGTEPVALAVTALGGSPGTDGVLRAEVAQFENLESLASADPAAVRGKIAFITERMQRTRDGSGYGKTVRQRSRGPFVAARQGAAALLIRSVGTDEDAPHTGMISSTEPGEPVPAAALSNRSADLLLAELAGGGQVSVELFLDCGFEGLGTSQNVIGEFDGSGDTDEFVVVGGHLDSWDLGAGAVDDGAGIAITTAAAKLVADLPHRPRRGIRVVMFANEEQGIHGGKAYARAHARELEQHVLGAESDLGSGRIYRFRSRVATAAEADLRRLEALLGPLAIPWAQDRPASGGADLGQMRKQGMPVIDLNQDATRYFDLHHTANDTLDQVEPADLAFNVAAYATLIYWAAQSDVAFGPVEPSE